jgi:ubiquinone/menaquinone biosynthesis C-methylase UbiE
MEFDAGVMLDRIGDITGWRCLDLGCGAGGITNLLAQRVGPSGHVVGLDTEASALVAAQHWAASLGLEGIEYVEGNAYASELPRACFDLVHVRFVMGTAGEMDVLLKEMLALTRPGGVVAAQEPDIDALRCYPPHPAWTRLQTALGAAFRAIGGDVHFARKQFQVLRDAGLEDVQYRPFIVGCRSTDPFVDYLPQTIESLRSTLLREKIIDEVQLNEALAACRQHLRDAGTVFDSFRVAQVWGRKPL